MHYFISPRLAASNISVSIIFAPLLFSFSASFFNNPNADSDSEKDVRFFFDILYKCGNFTVIKHNRYVKGSK